MSATSPHRQSSPSPRMSWEPQWQPSHAVQTLRARLPSISNVIIIIIVIIIILLYYYCYVKSQPLSLFYTSPTKIINKSLKSTLNTLSKAMSRCYRYYWNWEQLFVMAFLIFTITIISQYSVKWLSFLYCRLQWTVENCHYSQYFTLNPKANQHKRIMGKNHSYFEEIFNPEERGSDGGFNCRHLKPPKHQG